VREASVYCELVPGTTPWSELAAREPAGLILSGGPASVYDQGAPQIDPDALRAGVPVLGICYGMQLIAHHLGGKVAPASKREYGPATLTVNDPAGLFEGLPGEVPVWMSHGVHVLQLAPGAGLQPQLAGGGVLRCGAGGDGHPVPSRGCAHA
jgi:GMP synthase (glutamine-hydrolysing)